MVRQQGDELHRQLWGHQKVSKRTPTLVLPKRIPEDYLRRSLTWNKQVIEFADRFLPEDEASAVEAFPHELLLMSGHPDSFKKLDAMFKDNLVVLHRIEGLLS